MSYVEWRGSLTYRTCNPPYSIMRHGDYGPPMLFSYPEIRRMLKLVEAGKDDVFYDLGCGWGQNLIVAATEFGVRKCVGIEMLTHRFRKAKEFVSKRSLSKQIK